MVLLKSNRSLKICARSIVFLGRTCRNFVSFVVVFVYGVVVFVLHGSMFDVNDVTKTHKFDGCPLTMLINELMLRY